MAEPTNMPPAPGSVRAAAWRQSSSWTLAAKLVGSMLALFAVITVVTAAASVVSLDRFLTSQIDDQLRSSLARFTGTPNLPRGDDIDSQTGGFDRRGPGDEGIGVWVDPEGAATRFTRTPVTLAQAEAAMLAVRAGSARADSMSDPATATAHNINLGGQLGDYRVMATTLRENTLVVGLPRGRQAKAVANATRTAVLASLGGLLAVGLIGTWLIQRNLRPLREVADTAQRVTKQHLASGQVALAERVPTAYTDSRTEVGQVGQALNELLDHVDDALNARHRSEQQVRQFVADASHELRTPLASIRGYAELTRKEPEPVPPSVTHAIGRVEAEATRMSSLVEDLLLLARLDAGRPLERQEVDLTELVVNAVSDAHAASPAHRWRLEVPDAPVLVTGDRSRLHQIVANLLANARVHTGPGTTVLTTIARDPVRGLVRLSVHDDGPGIPAELQGRIFQRFTRGDSGRTRESGSTGLGLSIVAAVAAAHGGQVEVRSTPGDTTFSVLLPIPDAESSVS